MPGKKAHKPRNIAKAGLPGRKNAAQTFGQNQRDPRAGRASTAARETRP